VPTISSDELTRLVTVAAPDTEVTVQQLVNAIRDWQDELENMNCADFIMASGKEDLGGGLAVGITLKLLNWKVKFEDRSGPTWVDCSVSGGNLVAVDGNNQSMNPIQPAAYVTVTVEKAVSAAITAAEAEWSQSEKDQIFADVDKVESDISGVSASLDEAKHTGTGAFERDKESLEAIRERGDEAWVTGAPSPPAKGFDL